MTAPTVAPVAALADDLNQLAVKFNAGMDEYAVSRLLQPKVPGLFGEDAWTAFLTYAGAVKRVDAFRTAGLDAHAQSVQTGAADKALKVLLDAAPNDETCQEVRTP